MIRVILLFILLAVLEVIALYYVKTVFNKKNTMWVIVPMFLYALIPLVLLLILRYLKSISITNFAWNVMSTTYGLLLGILFFKEHLTPVQWVGISLGFLSIFLVFRPSEKN